MGSRAISMYLGRLCRGRFYPNPTEEALQHDNIGPYQLLRRPEEWAAANNHVACNTPTPGTTIVTDPRPRGSPKNRPYGIT
jgi:hypothetical protein